MLAGVASYELTVHVNGHLQENSQELRSLLDGKFIRSELILEFSAASKATKRSTRSD